MDSNSDERNDARANPNANNQNYQYQKRVIQNSVSLMMNFLASAYQDPDRPAPEPPLPSRDDHLRQRDYNIKQELRGIEPIERFVDSVAELRYLNWLTPLFIRYFHNDHPINDENLLDEHMREHMLEFYKRNRVKEVQKIYQLVDDVGRMQDDGELQQKGIDFELVKEKMERMLRVFKEVRNSVRSVIDLLENVDLSRVGLDVYKIRFLDHHKIIIDGLSVVNQLAGEVVSVFEENN